MMGRNLHGTPAWFAGRTYHLFMMPGPARRLRLMADWTVGLCFARASAELGQLGHPPSLGALLDQAPGDAAAPTRNERPRGAVDSVPLAGRAGDRARQPPPPRPRADG